MNHSRPFAKIAAKGFCGLSWSVQAALPGNGITYQPGLIKKMVIGPGPGVSQSLKLKPSPLLQLPARGLRGKGGGGGGDEARF